MWCKRWHKRKDYSPPDHANGRQSGWHSVFHCQKSKLRTQLRWNNERSEVIYERVAEAIALPVRVVKSGTIIGNREFIPTSTTTTMTRRRRRQRRQWRQRRWSKLLILSQHDFFMAECRSSVVPISTAIGFFRNTWLVECQ